MPQFEVGAQQRLRRYWLVLFLLILAAVPRWLWMSSFRWLPVSDSAWYHERALGMAQGLGYSYEGVATAFYPVGYPGFLAGLFLVFPGSSSTVAAANLALGLGIVVASLFLFRELGMGESRSRLAALLVALCPTMILYTTLEMSETLFTFLLVTGTVLLLVSRRRPGVAIAAGLFFGAAVLVRSQVIFLPAAMICVLLVASQGHGRAWALRTGALVYLAIACIVLPWTARNWQQLGAPVLVSTNAGYNLLIGHNPWQRWGSGYPYPPAIEADLEPTPQEQGRGPGEIAWDRRLRDEALDFIRQDPVHSLLLVPRKVLRHFSVDNEVFIQNDQDARAAGDSIDSWPAITPITIAFHIAILLGALLAFAATVMRKLLRWQIWFCALPAAYFAAISAAFFAEQRFNFPALPFLIASAVIGYGPLAERIAAGSRLVLAAIREGSSPGPTVPP